VPWVILLLVVVATLGGVVIWLNRALSRAHRDAEALRERVQQLEADLGAALRPPPPTSITEKAFRRMFRTASTLREQGIAGLMASSIEELQAWASTERQDILNMADPEGRVTLMFSDIEDSTPLNERLGDDAWVRVLSAHDSLVRARVDQYRGQVVKTAGDGFMVAFRDAEAACRAARGIQKDLRRTLDPRLRSVRVRIGVHTGEVISRDGDYFGRNVAIAARVGDLADGGEVLVTDAVAEALDDDAQVTLEEVGEVELKGLPGEYRIWRVLISRHDTRAAERSAEERSDGE